MKLQAFVLAVVSLLAAVALGFVANAVVNWAFDHCYWVMLTLSSVALVGILYVVWHDMLQGKT